MDGHILVLGKNSYVGNCFTRYVERVRGANAAQSLVSWSSKDCNLLDAAASTAAFAALPRVPFTAVIFAVINKSVDNSYGAFVDNTRLVQNFIAAQKHALIESVVYISSVDVYGAHPPTPIVEETRVAPDTWYGLAKYSCEWMITHELACPATVVRIPGVFGHAPNDRSVIGKLVKSARERGAIEISGSGACVRDYVWVEDMSRLLLEIAALRYRGVLNAVTGNSHTVRHVAQAVIENLALSAEIRNIPADPAREFDLRFDTAKLRMLLPSFKFSELRSGIMSYATSAGQA